MVHVSNVPVQFQSKYELNSDRTKHPSVVNTSVGQPITPRRAISTIALNYGNGANPKHLSETHPLKRK